MILYIENTEDYTKKLLELINKFSKVAGYKISRSQLHFHMPITNRKGNQENNAIHNCFKKNKIPSKKPNQGCKRPVLRIL